MDCQATQSNVLCTNGYYGFQPVLNGTASVAEGVCEGEATARLSNGGHGGNYARWNGVAVPQMAWQRKRNREDAVYGNGEATPGVSAGGAHHNGTAAKRQCPDLYHAKLQQAMGGMICNGASAAAQTIPTDNGMDGVSIGTDSMMMMTDECSGMEATGYTMHSGMETVHTNGHAVDGTGHGVTTVGASRPPPHTCCTSRAQLCTMSLQQSYVLSSSQDCPRCLAGEPAPYLISIQQTVENLSKLY